MKKSFVAIALLAFPLSVFAQGARMEARTEARTSAPGMEAVECSYNAFNCDDFSDHDEAQWTYETCMENVGYDVHDLDRDEDGVACEALR